MEGIYRLKKKVCVDLVGFLLKYLYIYISIYMYSNHELISPAREHF